METPAIFIFKHEDCSESGSCYVSLVWCMRNWQVFIHWEFKVYFTYWENTCGHFIYSRKIFILGFLMRVLAFTVNKFFMLKTIIVNGLKVATPVCFADTK